MKPEYNILTTRMLSEENCKTNPNYLYIFGDNTQREGKGGQAIIRDCENSMGIATKSSIEIFFSDDNMNNNIDIIGKDIDAIKEAAGKYEMIVFPENGLGTGRANMQLHCPKTFLVLSALLLEEFGFNNIANLKSKNF